MYIPHELVPHQERYFDLFAAQLHAVQTTADLFRGICPPPEPLAGVRESRRPFPTRDMGAMVLGFPEHKTLVVNPILVMA